MHDIHDHDHPDQPREHHPAHGHCHEHEHVHAHGHHHASRGSAVLVLRPYTGISGDIMVAGLARMLEADQAAMDGYCEAIGLKELQKSLSVLPHSLREVGGWQARVTLPHEHSHRALRDILGIVRAGSLTDRAKDLACKAFSILAEAEGAVHGKDPADVTFHEVGALDSILDVCLAAALFDALSPELFVCGPLPVCDGTIGCAHGKLPAPAPAVMRLLRGLPVRGIPTGGETLTPTGVALLKAFDASFGEWPRMTVEKEALIYGTRVFENVPNGAIFAFGKSI